MIGTLLQNRYRIDAKLGEGGMGVVYRAHDSLLQRPVAIKTLTPALFGQEGARRLVREAQSAARLNHPNVVSIYDAVEEGGQFAIVMELVEGQTLRELLPVPVGRLVEIMIQVLQGLEYAHSQGIVHRDIKPENIVITKDGVAKLMDFGLARSEGRSRLTQTGMVVGTVAYLAPEQALGGQVDGRSDLYALGAVLYEAVAGRPPFESEDPISVITQHINVPPVAPHWHNPAVPEALERVILKLLAKDPARRYQTAREALDALVAVRASVQAASTGAPSSASLPVAEREKLVGPGLVELVARSPLVGREAELARLKELIDRTITGQGGVVLLTGALGIGKTRLLEEAATYARLRGVAVVTGKAYESAPPYGPFAKVLRELAKGVDAETLAARMGGFAADLVALIPELSRQLPRLADRPAGSPEDQKHRLFAGVAHFMASTGAAVPVLLLLDDMHLSDPASAELLNHLARGVELARLLIVVAFRPEEIPSAPGRRVFGQVVHELSREPFSVQIPLRPLTEEEVTDLIRLMANHPDRPWRFGQRIFRVSEGNPYFIEEVIKGLFEQGTLYLKGGQWSTDFDEIRDYSLLEVPTSVQGAIETRLRNLSDPTRQVLSHASVIGRQFDFDTLLGVTGTVETFLLDRVEEAIRAQLIREVRSVGEDVYEFAQPMLRQVLYEEIPRRRRRLLHRQVGEALEKLRDRKAAFDLEAVVHHFAEAEDADKTLQYARQASRTAAAVFAYDDAARLMRQAIGAADELDRPGERLELMEELGDVLYWAGRLDPAFQAYEDAFQFWKSQPAAATLDGARLCRKLGLGRRWGFGNPRTREYISEGLRLLAATPEHPERVKLIIARAFDHYWRRPEAERDYRVAEESAQEGYRLAEAIGSLQDMSAALDALAGIYEQTAQFPKALEVTLKRVPIVERLDDPTEGTDLGLMRGRGYESLGDFAEAVKLYEQGYTLASRAGRRGWQLNISVALARTCWKWNRWDEAERWCRVAGEADYRDLRPGVRRGAEAIRAAVAAVRGDLGEARRRQREFEMTLGQVGDPSFAWVPPMLQLLIAWTVGDEEGALASAEEALRRADNPAARLECETLLMQFASEAAQWPYVEKHGTGTLELARASGSRYFVALNCRSLGSHRREHGQLQEAETLLLEALNLSRVLDCPWDLGKTLRELAMLRRAQGQTDEAASLLREALTSFEALRAIPDAERTRVLM